jgi:hypothetical protein
MRLSSARGFRLPVNRTRARARARPRPRPRNKRAISQGNRRPPNVLTAIRDRFSLVFRV